MEFEKEFGISIPDGDTSKINTVQDIIDYIESVQA
jgi:acyl carrier protein